MWTTFIPLVIVLPLVGFWLWMALDMVFNENIPASAPTPFSWPPVSKSHWIVAFVLLNIFAAGYYYLTVYRLHR